MFCNKVDVSCIKGMLNNLDAKISSPMNRWIWEILEHPFKLVHIPRKRYLAPYALSWWRYTEADGTPEPDSGDSSDDKPPVPPEPIWEPDEETLAPQDKFPQWLEREAVMVNMAESRDKEQELQDIMCFLETFKPPFTTLARERQQFLN